MHTLSRSLTEEEQVRLLQHLQESPYEIYSVDHARAAGRRPGLNLVLYTSGKLVVQGKGLKEWVEFVLEPEILHGLSGGPSPETPDLPSETRIGIDESGKGDFFGPMAIAAFHLDPALEPKLREWGVQDSKRIHSDVRIAEIAGKLQAACPHACKLIVLQPETYNRLVAKMGSVNRLLAWGHASALESLLERFPETRLAVADQFGPEQQILRALQTRGRAITLEQRHRAESDPAVAAASILARHAFVEALAALGREVGQELPKGATHVRGPAEALVRRSGPEVLKRVAKTHFRTTRQVLEACGLAPDLLGTPEPKEWKGPGHR